MLRIGGFPYRYSTQHHGGEWKIFAQSFGKSLISLHTITQHIKPQKGKS